MADNLIYYVNFQNSVKIDLMERRSSSNYPLSYIKKGVLANPDSLAYLFYKLRQNNNLTKSVLSKKTGVSVLFISSVECGSRFPSIKFCMNCAELFGVNPEYVKNRWAREAVNRFSERLRERIGLEW